VSHDDGVEKSRKEIVQMDDKKEESKKDRLPGNCLVLWIVRQEELSAYK
jgi:hypothetical protein